MDEETTQQLGSPGDSPGGNPTEIAEGPLLITDGDILAARLAELAPEIPDEAAAEPDETPTAPPAPVAPPPRIRLADLAQADPEYAAEIEAIAAERAKEAAARAAVEGRQRLIDETATQNWRGWERWAAETRTKWAAEDAEYAARDAQWIELGRTDPLRAAQEREDYAARVLEPRRQARQQAIAGYQQAGQAWQTYQTQRQQTQQTAQASSKLAQEYDRRMQAEVLDALYHEAPPEVQAKLAAKRYNGSAIEVARNYLRDQMIEHRTLGYEEGYANAVAALSAQHDRDLKLTRAQAGLAEPSPDLGTGMARAAGGIPSLSEYDDMSLEQRLALRARVPNIDDLVMAGSSRR